MGAYCDFYTTPLVTIALTILFVGMFAFFPESPKFLIKQNQLEVSIATIFALEISYHILVKMK